MCVTLIGFLNPATMDQTLRSHMNIKSHMKKPNCLLSVKVLSVVLEGILRENQLYIIISRKKYAPINNTHLNK